MTLSTPQDIQVSPGVHKSLGLRVLLDPLREDRSYSILDLGPARDGNVRFWSQFSCRLYIQDFYRSYRRWRATAAPEEDSPGAAFSALFKFGDETVFDIILAWDLFNYFDLRELEALVKRLSRWCRPGTRLFGLISSLPNIPASPTVYIILNREQMIYEVLTRETKPSVRHEPRDILRLMAGFSVANSFLLRHGIREYVFEFR